MRAPFTFARALTRDNVKVVRNATGAELWLYDEIGFWGVSALDVATALAGLTGQRVTVRVNSPGGEVFDGIAIYNLIRGHVGGTDVVVDGLAASAASFIAMAGDTVTMAPHSRMMIHDAIGLCFGNAADMRDTAVLLDDLSQNIAEIYAARAGETGGDAAAFRKRMKAETWLGPQEALDLGLVDAIGTGAAAEGDGEDDGEETLAARWRDSMTAQIAKLTRERADLPAPVPSPAAARRAPAPAPSPAPVAIAAGDIRSTLKGLKR